MGSGVGHYVDARRGPPSWMGIGSGTPAFLRMSGPTRLPGWVMGGSNPASPQHHTDLPKGVVSLLLEEMGCRNGSDTNISFLEKYKFLLSTV